MPGYRAQRVSERIHQEISILFERGVSDPRLVGVHVTRVEVSGDLRLAKIFVAPIRDNPAETPEMMEGLAHATGFIRRYLAETLDLKFALEVRFLLDRAYEKAERVLQVLDQVEAEEKQPDQKGKKRTTR